MEITIRYLRGGKDPHDWPFKATSGDWKALTGLDTPASVDVSDCNEDRFNAIMAHEVGSDLTSPYIVECC
jgi:hypothetical protein